MGQSEKPSRAKGSASALGGKSCSQQSERIRSENQKPGVIKTMHINGGKKKSEARAKENGNKKR